jgi:hypothetical protein
MPACIPARFGHHRGDIPGRGSGDKRRRKCGPMAPLPWHLTEQGYEEESEWRCMI